MKDYFKGLRKYTHFLVKDLAEHTIKQMEENRSWQNVLKYQNIKDKNKIQWCLSRKNRFPTKEDHLLLFYNEENFLKWKRKL